MYKALCEDEFICVQMNNSNTFGRNEADKTIENTINQDSKTTSDGYIGFSVKLATTQKWVLNSLCRSRYQRMLNNNLNSKTKDYIQRELLPSAINFFSPTLVKETKLDETKGTVKCIKFIVVFQNQSEFSLICYT